MELGPAKTQRTFEVITDQIRGQIRSGAWAIGDRLPNERDLARTLEVSRHAVREALRALESLGMVELRKGASGGAFVAEVRPDAMSDVMRGMFYLGGVSLDQLTEVRLWLESLVVRVACERADESDFAALEGNVARAEGATRSGDSPERTRLNIEFHNLLGVATGNPLLAMLMSAVMNVLRELAEYAGPVMGMAVIDSRRRLIEHIRARDADKAVAEMEGLLKALHRHYSAAVGKRNALRAAPRTGGRSTQRRKRSASSKGQ